MIGYRYNDGVANSKLNVFECPIERLLIMRNKVITELRRELKNTKLSVTEISIQADVAYGTVWKLMEGGGSNLTIETANRLGSICNRELTLKGKR